jgi:PAS domain-containing protein
MKALLAGKAYEQVIELHAGGPESKWLHFTFYPLFDDTQSVPFSFVTVIKELPWQNELPAQDKELFQKEFLNTTSAMTWLIDDQEKLIFANPSFLRHLGLTEKDLNKKAVDVIPPFFKEIFEKEHRNVLVSGIAHKKIGISNTTCAMHFTPVIHTTVFSPTVFNNAGYTIFKFNDHYRIVLSASAVFM